MHFTASHLHIGVDGDGLTDEAFTVRNLGKNSAVGGVTSPRGLDQREEVQPLRYLSTLQTAIQAFSPSE